MAVLDYSSDKPDGNGSAGSHDLQALVDQASMGTRSGDGMYEVKDWEFGASDDKDTDNVIASALKAKDSKSAPPSSLGALGSLFARLTGSKVLTEQDLKPVLEGMKQHLMKKNVAKEIADKVCEGVGESLVGKKVGGFQSAPPRSRWRFFPNVLFCSYKCSSPFSAVDIPYSYPNSQNVH